MPWEWLARNKQEASEWTGFIEQGVRVEGKLELPGTFRVNGYVKGHLISEQSLVLGENAEVIGRIDGKVVVIAGKFEGVISASTSVEIQSTAVVKGQIYAPCAVLDPGSVFEGECHLPAEEIESAEVMVPVRPPTQG
jgi:cytoskeletal protein CcmA (bactofilin family)